METKFLDFEKAKVQELNLEMLKRTHKENDVFGKPLRGVYHYQLLDDILEECDKRNLNMEIYDLFAAQNKDRNTPGVVLLPQVEQQYGERAIEAHILRRVFANIRVTNFDDEENTTNIAVAFHQKGIQVGFGSMVKICHNQCMLNRQSYISTYSEKGQGRGNGATIPEVLDAVRAWLDNASNFISADRQRMERMKEIIVKPEQILLMIGMLTAMRVKCDSHHEELRTNTTYPLNQSQISAFTENLLLKQHHNDRISLWDFYNEATELYKATSMDIPNLLPQNRAMIDFLEEQFNF